MSERKREIGLLQWQIKQLETRMEVPNEQRTNQSQITGN